MKTIKFLPLLVVVALTACGQKTPATEPAAASAPAAAPAASVATPVSAPATAPVVAAASAGDLVKGEKIYTATCLSCHGAGVLGAPKFGDKTAWQPRIAAGKDTLYANAVNGFKMMPPKGGDAMLKDDDVKAAVDYMVSKAS